MRAIPITPIGDTLTLYAVFEIARFRRRHPVLAGLHVGPPLLAFEPRNFDDAQPPDLYEISIPLARVILVGWTPDWNARLLDTARKVGAWAARRGARAAATGTSDAPGQEIAGAGFEPPQPRMPLRSVFCRMQETSTAVAGFSLATRRNHPESAAAVLVDGVDATAEIRRRLELSEHTTLTFLATERGWQF